MSRESNRRRNQRVRVVQIAVAVFCLLAVVLYRPFFCQADMEPPPLTNLRYDEDYGYLRDEAARSSQWWEPLKFIPLDERSYRSLGSELRLRYESIKNDNWGLAPGDGYLWFRFLPYADLHASDFFRLFGQLVVAESVDREPVTPLDEDKADVLQLFGDMVFAVRLGSTLTLRVGRQLLIYGSGRLVDFRYGPNVLRPFDAARAILESGLWRCDAFYSRPVAVDVGLFDDKINEISNLLRGLPYAWLDGNPRAAGTRKRRDRRLLFYLGP